MEEISRALPGDYIVAAVFTECLVLVKDTGRMVQKYLALLRKIVEVDLGKECISQKFFKLADGKLCSMVAGGGEDDISRDFT